MTEVLIKLDKANIGENSDGGDFSDGVLEAGAITVDEAAYADADDKVWDIRGIKDVYFSITNQGGANALTWKLQQTHDEIPTSRDMTGAAWTDIDAEASLAFGVTATKVFVKPDVGMTAIRLRTRETVGGNDTTYKGRFVVGKYL